MAAQSKGGAADAEDGIPMQKTSPTVYIAAGVGVVALGVVLAMSLRGSSDESEEKAKAIKAKMAADDKLPKMTLKERQEHLKMTARAMELAEGQEAQKQAAEARAKAAAEQEKARAEARKSEAAAPAGGAAKPAKPKVSQKSAKKQLDSLDSLGSDIASALK